MNIAYASAEAPQTEQTEDGGVLAALGIDGRLFVFQLFNFALITLILWYLILKPLTKKMTERQKMIDESIENAKRVQDNLVKSEQKYQERIDQAKVEANKILEKAVIEAADVGTELKEKAKKEIDVLVDQAKLNIRHERDEMRIDLKKETANLVTAAVEKLLEEKMTTAKDKHMIEEMLKKM